ncbi:hypothetical protein Tco_0757021 [Tanacetum coccineum]
MFSESSSRSPSESEEKTRHKLRQFSASEERNKIRMMETKRQMRYLESVIKEENDIGKMIERHVFCIVGEFCSEFIPRIGLTDETRKEKGSSRQKGTQLLGDTIRPRDLIPADTEKEDNLLEGLTSDDAKKRQKKDRGVWIWKLYFDGKRDEGDSVGMDVRAADGGVTTREGGVTEGAAVRETVGTVVGRIAAANAAAAISVVNSGGGGI